MLSGTPLLILQTELRCFVAALENKLILLAVAVPEQLPYDKQGEVAASKDGVDRVTLSPLRSCSGSVRYVKVQACG